MPWQLTAVFLVLANSLRNIQHRRLGYYKEDLSVYAIVMSFMCVGLVALAITLPSFSTIDHAAAKELMPRFIFGGVLSPTLNFLALLAHRFITASLATFLSMLNILSVVIFASLFLGESLSNRQIFGAVILFSSVVMIGLAARSKTDKKTKRQITIGVLIYLAVALMIGPTAINEKDLIDKIGVETYLFYGITAQVFFVLLIASIIAYFKKSKKKITRKMHRDVYLAALLMGFSFLFFILSLVGADSTSLAFLAQIAGVSLTVILAYLTLNERSYMKLKLAGIVFSGTGLFLLFT